MLERPINLSLMKIIKNQDIDSSDVASLVKSLKTELKLDHEETNRECVKSLASYLADPSTLLSKKEVSIITKFIEEINCYRPQPKEVLKAEKSSLLEEKRHKGILKFSETPWIIHHDKLSENENKEDESPSSELPVNIKVESLSTKQSSNSNQSAAQSAEQVVKTEEVKSTAQPKNASTVKPKDKAELIGRLFAKLCTNDDESQLYDFFKKYGEDIDREFKSQSETESNKRTFLLSKYKLIFAPASVHETSLLCVPFFGDKLMDKRDHPKQFLALVELILSDEIKGLDKKTIKEAINNIFTQERLKAIKDNGIKGFKNLKTEILETLTTVKVQLQRLCATDSSKQSSLSQHPSALFTTPSPIQSLPMAAPPGGVSNMTP